jgi:hypothetical protein
MTNNIYPPDHLLRKWEELIIDEEQNVDVVLYEAFQAGADAELEACCEWLVNEGHEYEHVALRDARRPKQSLKEKALETLRSMQIEPCWINGINTNADLMSKYDILRCALESLPN